MKKILIYLPVLFSLILVSHFTLVGLSVAPFNPIKNSHPKIDSYINPLFSQNWSLFAPNPIAYNDSVQIKVEYNEGQVTDWIDITSPMIKEMHKNYFSPFNKMSRISTTLISELTTEEELRFNFRNQLEMKEDESNQIEKLDAMKEDEFERSEYYLHRYGSAYAKYLLPEEELENLEIRIIMQKNTPFSERKNRLNQENPWNVIMNFEKKEIDESVTSIL